MAGDHTGVRKPGAALKLTDLLALILIGSAVRGLIPSQALVSSTANVLKPGKMDFPVCSRALTTASSRSPAMQSATTSAISVEFSTDANASPPIVDADLDQM
ncbi:hypothetical protein VNG72_21600 [Acidiphilium acidophilum]|nr:hypothetical protein [Acidiphilium acidophilum]